MLKVNNKNKGNVNETFSTVSIVDLKQVNVC